MMANESSSNDVTALTFSALIKYNNNKQENSTGACEILGGCCRTA